MPVVPYWFIVFALIALPVVGINPSPADYDWYLAQRRPGWLRSQMLQPLLWLLLYGCLYAVALRLWQARPGLASIGGVLLLLLLIEGSTWLFCRNRRFGLGVAGRLVAWLWCLGLALTLPAAAAPAALLLLPLLVWLPLEALGLWQMRQLNQR